MQRSLVGSEMCIRDRQHPVRLEGFLDRALEVPPVSYTHLTLPTTSRV
ncbi:hypothetical protein JMUB7520_27630 [Staphylococcus aureus]